MINNYDVEERRKSKMKSDDRILVLKPIEGKAALSVAMAVDKRLFNGENKLHAVYDEMKGNWYMRYDMGGLPGGLQGRYVLFSELVEAAKGYFHRRNVLVTEIQE